MGQQSRVITSTSRRSLIDTTKPGLVSAYDFRNGSLDDLVGSNNGTQFGALDFEKQKFGISAKLHGADHLNLGTAADISPFFLSMWVRRLDSALADWLVCKYLNSGDSWRLQIEPNGYLRLYDDVDNAGTWLYQDELQLNNGMWNNIVCGMNADNVNKLWLNKTAASNNIPSSDGLDSYSSDHIIGDLRVGQSDQGFRGTICNIEIFNTDLTDSDVVEIYNRAHKLKSYFEVGVNAGESIHSGGLLENTPWEVKSGAFKIVDDGNGAYAECTTAGTMFLPNRFFHKGAVESAFGAGEMNIYKTNAGVVKIGIIESSSTPITGGYHIELDASENIKLIETGGATHVSGSGVTADEWNKIRWTRRCDSRFDLYLAGSSVGNATDDTVQSSVGVGIEMDVGDKLGLTGDYQMWWSPVVIEP